MKRIFRFVSICLVALALVDQLALADSNADLINTKVDRTIELTSHLVHVNNVITVENKASSGAIKSYTFTVEPSLAKSVAFVGAHVRNEENFSARHRMFIKLIDFLFLFLFLSYLAVMTSTTELLKSRNYRKTRTGMLCINGNRFEFDRR